MTYLWTVLPALVLLALIVLDAAKKIHLTHPLILAFYLPAAANVVVLGYLIFGGLISRSPGYIAGGVLMMLAIFYFWARLHLFPVRADRRVARRYRIMLGGRTLLLAGMYFFLLFLLACFFFIPRMVRGDNVLPLWVLSANLALMAGDLAALIANGFLRLFLTSRRFSITRRAVLLLTFWIPPVNFILWASSCKLVKEEYDYAVEKAELAALRVENDFCRTRYPLILVHGIGFRDLKYFNYWGRIPKALLKNGALVYYGNQEALGTIDVNARDIKNKILQVLEQTGAEKVNIIAHSKGGLDARYAISMLGISPYVASLTTMNTPHHGCKFVDKAVKLPEGLYRFVAGCFDRTFRRFGDRHPDFYTATHQFATAESEALNRVVHDMPGVYYQSYASLMKQAGSDLLLSLPYLMIRRIDGPNDGLVTPRSAAWGRFRGIYQNQYRRGISHGDMIDLKRQDYRGFDVVDAYIAVVHELKEKGF